MLILTKEEINEKINCFHKLIGVYKAKVDFLQKLLICFEKNGRSIDCIVLNICVSDIAEDIFTSDDQIQIQQKTPNQNEIISSSSIVSNPNIEFLIKKDYTTNEAPKSPSPTPIEYHECKANHETPIVNCDQIFNSTYDDSSNINHEIESDSRPTHNEKSPRHCPSRIIYGSLQSQCYNTSIVSQKSQPTVMNLTNNEKIASSLHFTLPPQPTFINPETCERKRESVIESKTLTTKHEYPVQLNQSNIFLSDSSVDEINPLHLPIKATDNSNNKNSKPMKLKQFKCEFCSNAFAQKGVLNRHKILRHSPTVVKPHICPKCQKGFTLKHHLKNHLKCKSGCRYYS